MAHLVDEHLWRVTPNLILYTALIYFAGEIGGVSYNRIHKLSARYNVFGRRIARRRASVNVAPPLDASGR